MTKIGYCCLKLPCIPDLHTPYQIGQENGEKARVRVWFFWPEECRCLNITLVFQALHQILHLSAGIGSHSRGLMRCTVWLKAWPTVWCWMGGRGSGGWGGSITRRLARWICCVILVTLRESHFFLRCSIVEPIDQLLSRLKGDINENLFCDWVQCFLGGRCTHHSISLSWKAFRRPSSGSHSKCCPPIRQLVPTGPQHTPRRPLCFCIGWFLSQSCTPHIYFDV